MHQLESIMTNDDLTGYYTYRSLLNNPQPIDDFNLVKFAEAEVFLYVDDDGSVRGSLSFPADPGTAEKSFMDFEDGKVISQNPFHLHFVARGRSGTAIASFVYEYDCTLSHEWDFSEPRQRVVLTGTVRRNEDHGQAKKGVTASFVAVKRDFVPPREIDGRALIPAAIAMLASRAHRLRHTVWHTVRGDWFRRNDRGELVLNDDDRNYITALGWGLETPPFNQQGQLDLTNGAGEDFLFMHRRMIAMLKDVYQTQGKTPPAAWDRIPGPIVPQYNYQPQGSAPGIIYQYKPTDSGEMVPPGDSNVVAAFGEPTRFLKSSRFFTGIMRNYQNYLRNPRFLSSLSLGALGNLLEFTIHNWMHMRWTEAPPRDPITDEFITREAYDVDEKWDVPTYDLLADFHSSHVNPIFWRLHGWVDNRIEDWFSAHELAIPGSVTRKTHKGIDWFEQGTWVIKNNPFDWPETRDGGHGHHGNNEQADIEIMLQVIERLKQADERSRAALPAPVAVHRTRTTTVLPRFRSGFASRIADLDILDSQSLGE